jgi:hypothetical protein
VRLSPKSIFLGIVALGLPFSITVGWQLGTPEPARAPVSAPAGAGGIGAAPTRAAPSEPVTVVDWSSPEPRAITATSAPPVAPSASATPSGAQPSVGDVSPGSLPTLTLPPVPTPTDATSAPPSPSATPSSSAAPTPSGVGTARLVHRP